jgi:hypothetical protein
MKKILVWGFLAAILLASCSDKSSDKDKLMSDSSGAVLLNDGKLKEKPNDEIIMKLLYGNYNGSVAVWNPKETKVDKELTNFAEGEQLISKIILKETKTIQGNESIIVVTQSNIEGNDCRVCAPAIGAFIFTKKDSAWFCDTKNYYIGEIGSYGEAQEVKLIEVGQNTIGLLFEVTEMTQGYYYEGSIIYPFYKGRFVEAINFQTLGNNNGADEEQWSKEAKFKFIPNSNEEYYDLIIETTGNEFDENTNRIVNATKTVIYAFKDGKYRVVHELAQK